MAGDVVAHLKVVLEGSDTNETQSYIEIHGSEQFYLGRNAALCRHSWPDLVISNRHLRIHCVLYEQDPVANIPPFVYATDLSTNGTYLKKANVECTSSQGRGIRMGRKTGSFLLDDGDELRLSDSVTLIFRALKPVPNVQLTPIQQLEKQLFSSPYVVTGRVLGVGGFGKVMMAIEQRTQRQVACKIINLKYLWSVFSGTSLRSISDYHQQSEESSSGLPPKRWPTKVAKCFREFDILKQLSHPNIITIVKAFWSSNTIFLFQELVTGGDLFSYLEYKRGRLCDVETAVIIRQILKGVEYLHDQNIVHRDLKPDNILMTSLDDGARIVITDFGNARVLPDIRDLDANEPSRPLRMFSLAGTLEYTAPEIMELYKNPPVQRGYTKSVDLWSIGTITCTLLSGDVIFVDRVLPNHESSYRETILARAFKCDLSALDDDDNKIWQSVGSRPKDFIKNLLVVDEDRRMTAHEALAHSWFSNSCHAAEFDALYERAIHDWQPRRNVSQLVEPISTIPTNLRTPQIPEELLSQEVSSHYFLSRPRSSSELDNSNSLAVSPLRQPSTSLRTSMEDDEDRYDEEPRQEPQRNDKKQEDPMFGSKRVCFQSSIGNPMNQLSDMRNDGTYTTDKNVEDYDYAGHECRDPLYATMDSQYNFSVPSPPPYTSDVESDSIVVHETPVHGVKRPVSDAPGEGKCFSDGGSSETSADELAYFEHMPSKRRKLHDEIG